jgi:TRAP-type mannitol/chloroaromatic compound transport system substrate-binding protein
MDNYSRDLQDLINKHKVNVIRTPKSIMAEQLKAWDKITAALSKEDPFFAKVVESQRAWFASAWPTTSSSTRPTTSSATSTSSRPSSG